MSISNRVKEILKTNKAQIELLQLAMTSSIAGLIYSEFIRNFKQVLRPVHKIFIPEIKQVRDLLNPESEFMIYISNNIIDDIIKNELFQEFSNMDDLILFQDNNIEILKTIVDLYILPNITRTIPTVIANKFGIGNDNNQTFIESNEIDIFQRKPLHSYDSYLKYIIDQTVLQMVNIIPDVKRSISAMENNAEILIFNTNKSILTIGNENAISVIYFNKQIFENEEVMKLLQFVTSTSVTPKIQDNNIYGYSITTNPYNQVLVVQIGPPLSK